MTSRLLCGQAWRGIAAGLLVFPLWALAQGGASPAAQGWRAANDTVGQFRRGHADLLKWEQSRQSQVPGPGVQAPGPTLASAADAVRQAWQACPGLSRPLARLAQRDVELISSGHWLELDPGLSFRTEGFAELIEVAAQARKAWIDAVASRQIAARKGQALEAAQAAEELGARMVSVGNWSRLQQVPQQLARLGAESDLRRARYEAAQAQARLIKVLQLTGIHAAVVLPEQLPELPAEPMPDAEFQQRLARIQGWLPRAGLMRSSGMAALAHEAHVASHAIARNAQEVQQISSLVTEETQLHYNGMLKSSWDLLAAVQNQTRAAASALAAQRDFELAQVDLQWTLLGGEPDSLVTLGEGSADAAAAAGH